MVLPFSEDEVKAIVRWLNSEGAPGPNDILVFFKKDCWETVGHEVMTVLEDFKAD